MFRCGDEQLRHVGHAADRGHADFGAVGIDGEFPPAEYLETLFDGDRLDALSGRRAFDRIARKEADPGREALVAVRCRVRQIEVDDLAQQFDGQLDQDAGTVTAIRLGARRAAMLEVFQGRQSVGNDGVRPAALDVGDHGDAARVRLVLRVVQTLRIWQCREQH